MKYTNQLPHCIMENKNYGFLRITKDCNGYYSVGYHGEKVFHCFQWHKELEEASRLILEYLRTRGLLKEGGG